MAKKPKSKKYKKPAAESLQSFVPKVIPDKTKYKRKPKIKDEDS